MKALILMFLALPAFSALEVSPPSAGRYGYAQTFQVLQKLHYEVVYDFTSAGHARLQELQKRGYECVYKMRETFLCKNFPGTDGAAAVVESRVKEKLVNSMLELGERVGEPGLISKGEDVAEYLVVQPASIYGKHYDSYRLLQSQGNTSIRFGEPTEAQFSLSNSGALSMPLDIAVTESKTEYSIYFVMADFRRM